MHKGDLSPHDLRENTPGQATGGRQKTHHKDPNGCNDTRDEPLPCSMPGERGCAPSPGARRAHAQLLVPHTWHSRFVLLAKPRLNTAVSLQGDFEFKGTQVSDNWGLFYYYYYYWKREGCLRKSNTHISFLLPSRGPFVGQKIETRK